MTWLKLAGGAAVIALLALGLILFGNAREQDGRLAERVANRDQQLATERKASAETVAAERRVTAAVGSYADRAAAIQPIVLHSTDTVTRYAETSAGRAACLGPDRVRGLDALDAQLFPAQPAGSSADAVQADPGPPPS